MRKKAFTLIELLVVISIIALLMAILMPALGRARESAKNVICGTNLKQIGVGTAMYVADYNGRLPSAVPYEEKNESWNPTGTGAWFNPGIYGSGGEVYIDGKTRNYPGVGAYIDVRLKENPLQNNSMPESGSVLLCPSLTKRQLNDVFPTGVCYGMNFEFTTASFAGVSRPGDRVLFADSTFYFFTYDRIQEPWISQPSTATVLWDKYRDLTSGYLGDYQEDEVYVIPGRHGAGNGSQSHESAEKGKTNVMFVDGHVEGINRSSLDESAVDDSRDNVPTKDKVGTRMIDNGLRDK
ncbi:type II secretion system protein G [Sedimentisphaera cyanobacteriorum]|uniref:Type II secretion system protein G n=1 Tax=Sedimentisphaera cyanobacteriorum TaxID=1940790 RepID=A0A1Q2HSP2_9BACT|nr:type II secretion system protein [Sedimentisphaera cyanobacteriorum]AQQ10255.1 type II secretion system protein G [Sedimentisphaera cyanobacteriorum]